VIRALRFTLLCLPIVVVLFLAACGSGTTACSPGVRTVEGVRAHVNCGPAKATVTVRLRAKAPTTYHFRNGQCRRYEKFFAVDIGTLVVGLRSKKTLPFFGLLIGKFRPSNLSEEEREHFAEGEPVVAKDGTYKGGLIAVYWRPDTAYSFSGGDQLTVTLRKNRHAGDFVGSKEANTILKTPAMSISGTFTC
jgi:hypothetical protein